MELGERLVESNRSEAFLLAFNPKTLILSMMFWGFGSKRIMSDEVFSGYVRGGEVTMGSEVCMRGSECVIGGSEVVTGEVCGGSEVGCLADVASEVAASEV